MMDIALVEEFEFDWVLSGKSKLTAQKYGYDLKKFFAKHPTPNLNDAKQWVIDTPSQVGRRKRGQALRAFGNWLSAQGIMEMVWTQQIPLAKEKSLPQQTATQIDYANAMARASTLRDKAVIEVLWSTGVRRSELCALEIGDIDFLGGFIVVRVSKTGKPRVVPISPTAKRALRRLVYSKTTGTVFNMTPNAVRLLLRRLEAPSAHAWRRGWAVQALRTGVSETSVRAAAGWASGAMVARYTRALSGELAVEEFQRSWTKSEG
jgi:integrase/recombinase XerD